MKKLISAFLLFGLLNQTAMAHHPAADILDEDTWNMIDELVADTPHATLDFDSMGSSSVVTVSIPSDQEEDAELLASELSDLSGDDAQVVDIDGETIIQVNMQ